jgi:hypothetical protein
MRGSDGRNKTVVAAQPHGPPKPFIDPPSAFAVPNCLAIRTKHARDVAVKCSA